MPNALLFDRLPERLFRPLAAPNNARYWALICHLVDELWGFGGHAVGEEVLSRQVTRAIEAQLVADDPWDGQVDTPPGIRANEIYKVLVEAGWLAERPRGVRRMVTIRPVIAQFHELLVEFATAEPDDVGAKIESIKSNIEAAANGKWPQYHEAALQAKKCVAHIANTGLRVQDLMDELVAADSASAFARGFFGEYVEKLFIADYRALHTREHPLRYRGGIIAATLDLANDEKRRGALVEWYRTSRAKGDAVRASALYERDTKQLLDLREIGRHLDGLDAQIRSANQRALEYFRYKTRTPSHFGQIISKALQAVAALPDEHHALPPAGCVAHASPFGIPDGRRRKQAAKATKLRRQEPTTEQAALNNLRLGRIQERKVTGSDLVRYVERHLNGAREVRSEALQVTSVKDLCCYHHLIVIAARSACPPTFRAADFHLSMAPSLRVTPIIGEVTSNHCFEHESFIVRMREPQT